MLSEKEIEELKKGAYGVTRDGHKARYLGPTVHGFHSWVLFANSGMVSKTLSRYEGFDKYFSQENNEDDIIGLWSDKPEPFDLERALAGEPLIDLHNNEKLWLYKSHKDGSLITEYENTDDHLECANSLEYLGDVKDLSQCFGMWKEPVKPSADYLPKPIRVFGDLKNVWRFAFSYSFNAYIPVEHSKTNGKWINNDYITLNNGCYYATKEDCQAVCDWLMNR